MKNKKQLLLSTSLMFTFFPMITWADEQPHLVLTNNCPFGQTCCPTTAYCSYVDGSCGNTYNWYINGTTLQAFNGVQKFELFRINSRMANSESKLFTVLCEYGSDSNKLTLYSWPLKLSGSWQYTGFGNSEAYCPTHNPLDCTAMIPN